MYEAHCKREAVNMATEVRNAMISGMWSNSNLDDGKSTRQQALEEIEQNYQDVIESIYSGEIKERNEFPDHPLFTAINVGGNPVSADDRTTTTEQT